MSHMCIGGCGWPVVVAGRICESCRAQPWRERDAALAEIHKLRKELGVATAAKLQACLDRDAARAELVALRERVEAALTRITVKADAACESSFAHGLLTARGLVRAALEDT